MESDQTIARRSHPERLRVQSHPAPDGWELRAFHLPATGEACGTILFLGGRGDFFEKYLEAIRHWADAGWNVEGFDWRGQGGSGLMHPDGYCHAAEFGPLLDDLAHFSAARSKAATGPRIAIGHSLGGHLLLRALAERKVSFDGAVLLAPMLGIRAGPLQATAVNRIGAIGAAPFLRRRPVWSEQRNLPPGRLTSCPDRHADKLWWKQAQPELARGGPTWGWLAAATRSMVALERILQHSPLATPGLILTASEDPIVDVQSIQRIAGLLPGFELAEISRAGHELLRESDGPRQAAMAWIADFLEQRAQSPRG